MSNSLSEQSTDIQANSAQAWMRAAETGDAARLHSLLKAGVGINFATENGETALMRAAAKGYTDVVGFLLDEGAEINAQRDDGFNALIVAVFFGQEDVVRALLSHGADTSARTRLGTTAEKWAAARGFVEIVELLKTSEAKSVHASKEPGDAHSLTESIGKREGLPVESVNKKTLIAGNVGGSTAELLTRRLQQSLMQEADAFPPASMPVAATHVGLTKRATSIESDESEAVRAPLTPTLKLPPRPLSSSQRFREAITSWPVTMIALPLVLISGGVVGYAVWQKTKTHANALQPAPQATTQTVEQSGAAQQPAVPFAAPPVLNAETQPTPLIMPQSASSGGVPLSDVNVMPPPGGSFIPATETGIRPNTSTLPSTTALPSTPALISESSNQASDIDAQVRRESRSGQRENPPTPPRSEKSEGSVASPAPLNAGVTQTISAAPLPQPTPKKRVIQWP